MGKASITINVGALWNGQTQLDQVTSGLKRMERLASQSTESTTRALALNGQQWSNLGSEIYNTGTRIATFGDALTQGVTVPMQQVGNYCVTQADTFDTALANLNKTADLTADELQEFGDAALEASKSQPVTADTILNAEALGAQLGISNDNLQEFASTVTGLDIATNMNVDTAATQLAQFANITGMSQKETENYGSTIVDLGNHLATTEKDISKMSLRLAGVSTTAKFSNADILGLAGALSSLGIKAEAGGSAMTRIIANISKEVSSGGDKVERYTEVCGISADEFANKWKDKPIEAIEMMVSGLNRMSKSGYDINTVLDELGIKNIRDADAMRRLAGQSDTLKEAVDRANTAWQENTALATEVEKRNQSIESRFQTLQNKVNAAATEVGTVLANALLDASDAASPLIEGIGDAAKAFADMDPSAQTAITTLMGVAAAAGPVLSVSGRLVQAMGNVASKIGGVKQSAAVFGDALNTVDGSQMRVYASSNSLASILGTAGNAAAQAAGSAENYVHAWENMYDAARRVSALDERMNSAIERYVSASDKKKKAIEKEILAINNQRNAAKETYEQEAALVSQWSGSTSEAEKYAKGVGSLSSSLEKVKGDFEASGASSANAAGGLAKFAANAKGVVSSLGSMAAGFAKAAAGSIAIAAIGAAVGYVAEKYMEAKEHAELMGRASQSAADIMAAAKGSAQGYGDAIGSMDFKAEETTKKLAELNDSVASSMADYELSSAKLDQYVATIDKLAGKSNLTAAEQWRLEEAVKGYNEVTGDSISLTEDNTNRIKDSSGEVQNNTDKVHENADAWKKRAEAEAYQKVASQYMEAELEALGKLRIAQNELADAQQRRAELEQKRDTTGLTSQEILEYNKLKGTIDDLNGTVEELSSDYQTAAANSQYFTNMAEVSASNLADGIKQTLTNLPSDMQTAGVAIANSLAAGIDAGKVTSDQAAAFLSQGVVGSVQGMPDETKPYGLAAAEALAAGISDGSVSVEQANSILAAASTGNLGAMESAFANAGVKMPDALAGAIRANAGVPAGSMDYMKSLIAIKLAQGDLEEAAKLCGGHIDEGLEQAIKEGTLSEEAAGYLGQDVIDKLNEGAGCHSPSVKANETGSNVDAGLAEGINGNSSAATGAASTLGQSLIDILNGFDATGSGSNISGGFASGIGSGVSSVLESAVSLAQNLSAGISGAPGEASSTGTAAGANFASGIGCAQGTTSANAAGLSSAASGATSGVASVLGSFGTSAGSNFASGIGSGVGATSGAAGRLNSAAKGAKVTGSYGWGSDLASNFADGIRAGIGWVSRAANAIANAAKSILHFSAPEKGPWSGAERGGVRSGMHLAQNFAAGMRAGIPEVERSASALAQAMAPSPSLGGAAVPLSFARGGAPAAGATVTNNTYTLNINGSQLRSASPRAQELIAAVFDEFSLSADMGVA